MKSCTEATLTNYLVEQGVFAAAPFSLIDVGCSGGLNAMWRIFKNSLVAVGFDPMEEECRRLRDEEKNPQVSYVNAFVGLGEGHPLRKRKAGTRDLSFIHRRSSFAAGQVLSGRCSPQEQITLLNNWSSQRLTTRPPVALDDHVRDNNIQNVDFLKVDVDGTDHEVLLSFEQSFTACGLLGVTVECSFETGPDETQNGFHNIDRMLRRHGFDLYDLNIAKYSRSALPAPFKTDRPGMTITGKAAWGDGLYFRDICAPQNAALARSLATTKILKLVCCMELFRQHDSAAEILTTFADRMPASLSVEDMLNMLVRSCGQHGSLNHKQVLDKFHAAPQLFYRSNHHRIRHCELLVHRCCTWAAGSKKTRRFLVLGANETAELVGKALGAVGFEFIGYVDSSAKRYQGQPVFGIHELAKHRPDLLVIASSEHGQCLKQLVEQCHPDASFDIVTADCPPFG